MKHYLWDRFILPKQSVMAGRDFDAIWPCITLTIDTLHYFDKQVLDIVTPHAYY
ncbi:hypothetical protein [Lacticaseibacillus rhamnosus]|uniref:Uncharacterized protein n=1 Tax=Lacticaseibacillus rhamnosus (strain LMS2-1) TaxID=525361 RepID=C2JYG4_LACRM|nr:hypothetical protein [Lacticaseibacillus rhamnosus]AER65252.1 conserved hypothetical protein [Lacticaseibacillus rhamnosus ATCC 8530]EEN79871.1 hypothetical protein HMPREF0539_1949 [Lacticaseibacillus rhamnosus LMS2-1]KRK30430.1 hypothetical protein Q777_GL000706 [Lacticaseibacillus rhamnosus DSM 20021 = JCM 1136 = NBRC 3425]CAR91341.1 Putative protein without homology [Lacticaseibacillus rhamnosus Lc 705]MCE3043120.1 hypothetical protein [Lacticaseibacillus rhamnosus]